MDQPTSDLIQAAPSASGAPRIEAPESRTFWQALITGPGGFPDESTIIFLWVSFLLSLLTIYYVFVVGPKDMLLIFGAWTAWLGSYQTFTGVRGAIGKGQ